MTKQQLKDFKNGKYVINCKTEKEAEQLMKLFDSKKIKWLSGDRTNNIEFWYKYKSSTSCKYLCEANALIYGIRRQFYNDGYVVKNCSDLFPTKQTQPIITDNIIDEKIGRFEIVAASGKCRNCPDRSLKIKEIHGGFEVCYDIECIHINVCKKAYMSTVSVRTKDEKQQP